MAAKWKEPVPFRHPVLTPSELAFTRAHGWFADGWREVASLGSALLRRLHIFRSGSAWLDLAAFTKHTTTFGFRLMFAESLGLSHDEFIEQLMRYRTEGRHAHLWLPIRRRRMPDLVRRLRASIRAAGPSIPDGQGLRGRRVQRRPDLRWQPSTRDPAIHQPAAGGQHRMSRLLPTPSRDASASRHRSCITCSPECGEERRRLIGNETRRGRRRGRSRRCRERSCHPGGKGCDGQTNIAAALRHTGRNYRRPLRTLGLT
jgi:hypothetical protein